MSAREWLQARWWIWRHPVKAAAIRRHLAQQGGEGDE